MTDGGPASRAEFVERARSVGALGGWRLQEDAWGFTWRHPDRPDWLIVRLDADDHVFRVTEAAPGFRGHTRIGRATLSVGLDGIRAHHWADVSPRAVASTIGADLGWTERRPAVVRFALAMAVLGGGGALLTLLVWLGYWVGSLFR